MWNYRVVKTDFNGDYSRLAIHEAFYDDNGKLITITEDPVTVNADLEEGVEGLKEILEHMMLALAKPVINKSDL